MNLFLFFCMVKPKTKRKIEIHVEIWVLFSFFSNNEGRLSNNILFYNFTWWSRYYLVIKSKSSSGTVAFWLVYPYLIQRYMTESYHWENLLVFGSLPNSLNMILGGSLSLFSLYLYFSLATQFQKDGHGTPAPVDPPLVIILFLQ